MSQFQDRPLNATVIQQDSNTYILEIVDETGKNLAQHLITTGIAKAPSENTGKQGSKSM